MKVRKTFFSGLICPKNTYKKIDFFDKNQALTPLENLDFSEFLKKLRFSGFKNILFYPEHEKTFLAKFATKNSYEKIFEFFTKPIAKPLRKISIFLTFSKFHFSGLTKIFVYVEYQKRIFSGLFSLKIPVRKHTMF